MSANCTDTNAMAVFPTRLDETVRPEVPNCAPQIEAASWRST
jgi:hypothetical protein